MKKGNKAIERANKQYKITDLVNEWERFGYKYTAKRAVHKKYKTACTLVQDGQGRIIAVLDPKAGEKQIMKEIDTYHIARDRETW